MGNTTAIQLDHSEDTNEQSEDELESISNTGLNENEINRSNEEELSPSVDSEYDDNVQQIARLNDIRELIDDASQSQSQRPTIRSKKVYNNNSQCDHSEEIANLKDYSCGCMIKCLSKLKSSDIECIREVFLYNKNEHERNMAIRNYLDMTFDDSRIRHTYQLKSHKICRKSFLKLIGSSENKYNAVCKRKKDGIDEKTHTRKKPDALPLAQLSKTSALFFLKKIKDEVAEHSPNDLRNAGRNDRYLYYLPCGYTRVNLHQEYASWCQELNVKPLCYNQFLHYWKTEMTELILIGPKIFTCDECEYLKRQKLNASTQREKEVVTGRLEEHLNRQKEIRLFMESLPIAYPNSEILNCDGMESICLPHFIQKPKSLTFHSLPLCHVYGIVNMKLPIQYSRRFAAMQLECVGGKGVNEVMTFLHYYIIHNINPGSSLVIVSDNTYREMKNHFFLSFLQYLCVRGVIKEAYLFFPDVGHTHWLADQQFSTIKRIVANREIWLPEHVADYITKNNGNYCSRTIEAKVFWQIRDWKNFLDEHIKNYPGIASKHGFYITLDGVKDRENIHMGDWSECFHNLLKDIPIQDIPESLSPNLPIGEKKKKGIGAALKYCPQEYASFYSLLEDDKFPLLNADDYGKYRLLRAEVPSFDSVVVDGDDDNDDDDDDNDDDDDDISSTLNQHSSTTNISNQNTKIKRICDPKEKRPLKKGKITYNYNNTLKS
jgi:predicted transcriptional regulator